MTARSFPSFDGIDPSSLMTDKTVREKVRPDEPTDENHRGDDSRVAELIEQLKQRKVELEAANRELRHISHYRSLFLARMSHELRTPLTSILGFTEILLDQEQMTDPQRRFCQKIRDSGLQLLTSLNQLVDLSRLEAAPAQLFLQEFPLEEAMTEACAQVAHFAQKLEVGVECELAPDITTIVSDRGRFRQVLYTFVAWAVSRSSEGQTVLARADLNGSNLLVRIDDEGRPVNDISRLFDPDETDRAGRTDLNEMGIIVGRRLLEAMRGSVDLENREGGGLRTLIRIPLGQSKA